MPSPITSRRHVLALLAATPFAASGCAPSNLPDAYAAWRTPGAGEADPRRHALAHAILAPNPHNMQPWLVALPGENEIVLSPDLTRLLPATDPPNRQIVIGCGAFLELLDIAARQNGHRADITLWPDGEPQPVLDLRPIAHIRLTPDASIAKDPLYAQITQRRTNREPFDAGKIPEDGALQTVLAAGPGFESGFASAPERVARMRDLVWRGWSREMATPAALKESVDVMRIGAAEIAKHRDGLAMDGIAMEAMKALGLLSRETMLNPESTANREGAKIWKKLADTAPAFVWLRSADNTRATQIGVGRAYARMNLAATAQGLAMHPWSMALEEFTEMADLYAEQQAMLGGTAAAPVQMLARIGYGKTVKPTPRRGLDEHIKA
ncbi:MAG: Twin-arginine translocation pathway signal sequence domain protein [Alphaproteobacteria bacterium]|nr:MAG: Twin-arginine translocation pathway signal sequence domain protein [Caulobacteraceae bacterium]TPW03215.1 MAG: Twin-arginine translocation pathway signal sequence domain protein [Alphaproteobacteria bacterium]